MSLFFLLWIGLVFGVIAGGEINRANEAPTVQVEVAE